MSGWRHEPFDNVIADESGGNLKTPQSEFLPSGRYAIVDQGKELVAGYTNDKSRLCRAQLPVVVFGDHTRCFKYVDFPFCMGADGVKVLRPKVEADVKYLYHYFRQLRLTEGGYDRHFKYLKRSSVALPPLPEQQRIAEILDKADSLRSKRRAALAKFETLSQSIFLDMFGDPAAQRWPMSTVAGIAADSDGAIRTGPFGSQLLHSEFTDEGIAVLGIDNAVENEFRWGGRRFISEAKYRELSRYTVHPGDVLITIMGTCGRCAIVPDAIPKAINTKHLCCISLDRNKCLPSFLHAYFLGHPIARRYLAQKAKGAIMEGLNMGIIKEMPVPLVPIDLQVRLDTRLKSLRGFRAELRRSESELDVLFASLQHRAFRGEL